MAADADNTPVLSFPALVGRQIADETVPTVDARELHRSLGVGKVFGAWIVERIASYGFTEGTDFEIYQNLRFPNPESAKARQQSTKEYALTLDMAKELAMVERNAAGRAIRRYFIICERSLREERASAAANAPAAPPPPGIPFLPGPERLVSSLHVAQALRRRHTGILRLLDVLAAERSEMLGQHIRFATYLHENGRPYRCFHLDRAGFDALMARIPFTDGASEALRAATLAGWPKDALPPPSTATAAIADGHAVMRVGDETLVVDMSNFHPVEGQRAVLFDFAGGILVDRAVCHYPHQNWYGRRIGHVLTVGRDGERSFNETGWVIGTVIEPRLGAATDGAEARARHLPRLAKVPRALPAAAGRRAPALALDPLPPRRGATPPACSLPDLATAVTSGAA